MAGAGSGAGAEPEIKPPRITDELQQAGIAASNGDFVKAQKWNQSALEQPLAYDTFLLMSFAEIEETLPKLTAEELMRLEALLHRLQRERRLGVLYDDAYGVWTEDDQVSVVAEAWDVLESGDSPQNSEK